MMTMGIISAGAKPAQMSMYRMPVRFSSNSTWNPTAGTYSRMIDQWEEKIKATDKEIKAIRINPNQQEEGTVSTHTYFRQVQIPLTKLIKKRAGQVNALRTMVLHHQYQIVQTAKALGKDDVNGLLGEFERSYHKIMDTPEVEEQQKLWNQMADTLIKVVKTGNL